MWTPYQPSSVASKVPVVPVLLSATIRVYWLDPGAARSRKPESSARSENVWVPASSQTSPSSQNVHLSPLVSPSPGGKPLPSAPSGAASAEPDGVVAAIASQLAPVAPVKIWVFAPWTSAAPVT